ncbi:MAG: energy-coupling factor transporter transmembrane protein EcfT [Spirochaetaceae bacterium]|nr:MAG: energy-coupling factor transporter transmembrane protein EcfT [Spirochaetaceae bacterium]
MAECRQGLRSRRRPHRRGCRTAGIFCRCTTARINRHRSARLRSVLPEAAMNARIFENYERITPLSTVNPTVKILCSVAVMLFVSVVFDLQTLTAVTLLGLAVLVLLGRVPLRTITRAMVPFMLFGFGFLWMNALLPRAQGTVLASWGPVLVSAEGLLNGISFFLRALSFGVWSLVFVASTDPTLFVLSLMHQLRVKPRIAYSALAAYRYLPMLQQELEQIRAAHRLRGMGEHGGLRGRVQRIYRYTIPLLAGALRRATRVAAAMEARAFSGERESWYRTVGVRKRDFVYLVGIMVLMGVIIAWGVQSSSLSLWSGRLWE